jgi:hypothetical protein
VVQEHVKTSFAHVQDATGADLLQFDKDEFDGFPSGRPGFKACRATARARRDPARPLTVTRRCG